MTQEPGINYISHEYADVLTKQAAPAKIREAFPCDRCGGGAFFQSNFGPFPCRYCLGTGVLMDAETKAAYIRRTERNRADAIQAQSDLATVPTERRRGMLGIIGNLRRILPGMLGGHNG